MRNEQQQQQGRQSQQGQQDDRTTGNTQQGQRSGSDMGMGEDTKFGRQDSERGNR